MDYKEKYLKYKTKYLNLKNQIGGNMLRNLNCKEFKGELNHDMDVYIGSLNDDIEIKDRILKNYYDDKYKTLPKYICPKNSIFLNSLKDNKRIDNDYLKKMSEEMNKEWLEIVSFTANRNKNREQYGGSIEELQEKILKNINQLSSYKKIYNYCNSKTLKDGMINVYKLYEYIDRQEDDYFDILLVGAGPIGLILTIILLERYDNIKILLLDNRTTFSINHGDEDEDIVQKLIESENIEGERQPLNILIKFLIFELDEILENIIEEPVITDIQESQGTYCSVMLNNYLRLISNIISGNYKNRLRIMYSKKESPEDVIKKYNINILLDCTGGRSDISKQHDNLDKMDGLNELSEIKNYYYTTLTPPARNSPYNYQIFNYVKDKENIQIPQIAITAEDKIFTEAAYSINRMPNGSQKKETQQKLVDIISNKIKEDELHSKTQEIIDTFPDGHEKDEMQKELDDTMNEHFKIEQDAIDGLPQDSIEKTIRQKILLKQQHKINVREYFKKLKKKNIQRDWFEQIVPEGGIKNRGNIEISKKKMCNYNENYISILCGSGLIKTAPALGNTFNLSIYAYVCIVLKHFDKLFIINKDLKEKLTENFYIDKKTKYFEKISNIVRYT